MNWDAIATFAITQGPFGMIAIFLGWYLVKNQKESRAELSNQQKRHDDQIKEFYASIERITNILNGNIERNTRAINDLHTVTSGLNQIVTTFLKESLMTKSR